ncbi:hypothetical protein Marpi_1251 [Marinitoga piezophila KA3]|uniref:asparagine synthase (glutamine-hydrolyzing) n=1 Tax=Marinitoga piezophila (strain DSM 14283 / JCM 11233 / KA3) TaxID=443254 RepID=H2J2W4_MARPK|nr:asparagine synthase [Marinitoga piezophila]AEX85655.1 hypothetical protein Marpi_1251 [Marinitoga piezophila KA3]
MPGFFGLISNNRIIDKINITQRRNDFLKEIYKNENLYIERQTINKFLRDKPFYKGEDYVFLIEGVILNKVELINKYNLENFEKTIIEMYKRLGETFFNDFRGSFSGFFYDKKNNRYLIFTNHFGDKQIFYYTHENEFIIGSEINYIVDYLRQKNYSYNPDIESAYMLLTYGFMIEDHTLINEIKKLIAGHYIKIENGNFEIKQYYKLDNTPDKTLSENEIIENIDSLFKTAIRYEFEKDKEYNYNHIASLSGGLDSRMTVWIGTKMGYNMLNYTFSESDYLDETISKEIARDLKNEFLFKSLDNGLYLIKDNIIRKQIEINSGNVLYAGNAHAKSFADIFNFSNFGVVHTGQLGDVIIGSYMKKAVYNKEFNIVTGAYSEKLSEKIKNIKLKFDYPNEEIFKLYNRGFNGILLGNLPFQEYTEVISPFLYKEFIDYCLKIPLDLRVNHKIYFKWILKKHPQAAKYKWEAIGAKINIPQIKVLGRQIAITQIPHKIIRKILNKKTIMTRHHMNPLEYWYKNNHMLKSFFEKTFNEKIKNFDISKELKTDVQNMFESGKVIEKTQVLTLLEAYDYFWGEYQNE